MGYRTFRLIIVLLVALAGPSALFGQAEPTASRSMVFSGFAMGTGTKTGLNSRNAGITAGVDLAFRRFAGIAPEIEVRGTFPVIKGNVVAEKSLLGGLKASVPVGAFHFYGDFLYGRGNMNYQGNGYPVGNLLYLRSSTWILSYGGGVEWDIADHYAIKGDYQFQNWQTPVLATGTATTGTAHPQSVSLGLVYRFNVGRYPTWVKRHKEKNPPPPPASGNAP